MLPEENPAASIAPILMPKLGQAMAEGRVVRWHAQEGEQVQKGQVLLTVETDKATCDLEAPASGILHILVAEGEEVPVGTVVGEIHEARQEGASPAFAPETAGVPSDKKILASPRAKRLAAGHGVDLSQITPSGADGILSAADVERALEARRAPQGVAGRVVGRTIRERRRLTGIRKTAARRTLEAWQTIPHIVQMVDVDATSLLAAQARLRAQEPSLTLNDLILHAAARVMAAHPDLNGTVEGDTLVLYEGVNLGFAVDTPQGVVVPVIRQADRLSEVEVAAESHRLIEAARSGRLRLKDVGGSSLTVSNLGMMGIKAGTPVLNLGEAVLIFVGAVEERPVAVAGWVGIRPTLTLSVAYDHRVADGVAAASFTRDLKAALEALSGARPSEEGELGRRELRAVLEGSSYLVRVHGRRHSWVLDEPEAAGGTDQGPDPVSAFLGSLLSCMVISLKAAACRRKVTLERVEGRVRANPQGILKGMVLTLEVWSSDSEGKVRALLDPARRTCFLSKILRPDLNYKLNLVFHATKASSEA